MKSLNWNCSNQTKIQIWIDIQMRRHWTMTMRIFTKNRNVLNIWMRNQSFLLKIVKNRENLIEILIFEWISIAEMRWSIDVIARQIEKAIKFSITTRRKYWWSIDLNTKLIEKLICRKAMWMMSFRLHTDYRLNDVINCYA